MIDITGQKFNRLTAVRFTKRIGSHYYWQFLCSCGTLKIIEKIKVTTGWTKSCGCLQVDSARKVGYKNGTHKMSITRFYRIWSKMRWRCENAKSTSYYKYGGRGIAVCHRWKNFNNFMKDMYPDYLLHVLRFGEVNTTIERINNNGYYSPKNCRWATQAEQARNKRNTKFITYNKITLSLSEWAEKVGISRDTLYQRVFVAHWPVEEALCVIT